MSEQTLLCVERLPEVSLAEVFTLKGRVGSAKLPIRDGAGLLAEFMPCIRPGIGGGLCMCVEGGRAVTEYPTVGPNGMHCSQCGLYPGLLYESSSERHDLVDPTASIVEGAGGGTTLPSAQAAGTPYGAGPPGLPTRAGSLSRNHPWTA